MTAREIVVAAPIVILIVWMGLFPRTFLAKTEATVAGYIRMLKGRDRIFVQQPRPAPIAGLERGREPAR